MFKVYKKLLASIALTLTIALVVTLFSPVALAEEPEPSIPDLSNIICITIDEFSPETKVSDLVLNTALTAAETIEVYDKQGFPISNNSYVTNSSTIVIKKNSVVTEAYKVRLYGDLDCNGRIDTIDVSKVKTYLAGVSIEEPIVADVNADSIVNTTDLSVLKLYSAGIGSINQSRQFAFSSRFNWLNENKADYKIYGYTDIFDDFSVSSNDIGLTFSRYYNSCNTNNTNNT
ncbi:MAG: dockerin type I repeat-containing protein, partial [Clostridia bacterium]|nr:dockerin type I repeat-containing protein [Clostridia bacterium]